ncbi:MULTISPECIES: hypothetical protein [unclassified Micromonospora]|uniref:hypothetical protein n=1 Tax=unclassified Micromonospora TaxID=2617518 RepID=UPI00124B0C75|nr:hypothetical protein [Micromonospora sp. AMSO31t]KAB1910855.1 hypothetical protein F8274_19285 [Micromonospora sp. AMSO31t]
MSLVPPQQLAQERVVSADAVLGGQVDLRAYPHRHLVVTAKHTWGRSGFQPLMEAVEHLSHYGWELVNVTSIGDGHNLYAAMRRTA